MSERSFFEALGSGTNVPVHATEINESLLEQHKPLGTTKDENEDEDENEEKNEPWGTRKINRSLLELHKPQGTPKIQILFFHGLQPEDSSGMPLSTWKCGDGSYWPQTWLVDEFPDAHVLSVSYNGGTRKVLHYLDLLMFTRNLIYDFIEARIGQIPDCPVVLVAHSFGGLVIQQLCLEADAERRNNLSSFKKAQSQSFLDNVRGIFYFDTPHYESPLLQQIKEIKPANPDLQYIRTLKENAELLGLAFDGLKVNHDRHWRIFQLRVGLPTKLVWMPVPFVVFNSSVWIGIFVYSARQEEWEPFSWAV